MPEPVSYRFTRDRRTFTFWAVAGAGGILVLAVSYWIYAEGARTDWVFIVMMASAFFAVLAHAIYIMPRYTLSDDELRRVGILPEKAIRWDRLKQITITHRDEIRLEQHDGTTLWVPARFLEDGKQLKSRMLKLAAGVPVKELHAEASTWRVVRHLPLHCAAGGAGALAFWIGGLPWFVLRGCGWGGALALLILFYVRSWKAAKKPPKWSFLVMYAFMIPGIMGRAPSPQRELSEMFIITGAIYSGAYFTGFLLLIPFRRWLMEFVERDSSHPPADELAQEPG